MRSIRVVQAGALSLLAVLSSGPSPAAPIEFDRVQTSSTMALASEARWSDVSLSISISPDAAFVAVAQSPATVQIWSIPDGKITGRIVLDPRSETVAFVALVGNPCLAVVGVAPLLLPKGETPPATSLKLAECKSGNLIAQVVSAPNLGNLRGLVPVSSCGLVVAMFEHGIDVLDVSQRRFRDDLRQLLDKPNERAGGAAGTEKTLGRRHLLVGSSINSECEASKLTWGYTPTRESQQATIETFDLRKSSSQTALAFTYKAPDKATSSVHALFAVAPSGRFGAVSLGEALALTYVTSRPRKIAELMFADFGARRGRRLDIRNMFDVADIAFLDDDVLITTTRHMAFATDVILVDRLSGRFHTLCFGTFGGANSTRGNIRAMAIHGGRKLIAVADQAELRMYRYRRGGGPWAGVQDCVDD